MRYWTWIVVLAVAPHARGENPVERLQARLDAGQVQLEWSEPRGYLDSLLDALGISPATQTLVFSKTSAQFRLITPRSPRAIYFNDDVYVGWVRGGPILEISSADVASGAAFYTLEQRPTERPRFRPDNGQCLQCHESARTLGIPGHLTRSVHPDPEGQPVFRLGTTNVDQTTPFPERFGGWFVTGAPFDHRGNRILADGETLESATSRGLDAVWRPQDYLRLDSDILAHMLLVHQTQMHNRIAQAGLEARKALSYRDELLARFGEVSEESAASVRRRIEGPAEELLEMMLFAGEAPLPQPVSRESELAREFAARGELYALDLETRLLQTRLSYLAASDELRALPEETLAYLRRRLTEILAADPPEEGFSYLDAIERARILELLQELDWFKTVAP